MLRLAVLFVPKPNAMLVADVTSPLPDRFTVAVAPPLPPAKCIARSSSFQLAASHGERSCGRLRTGVGKHSGPGCERSAIDDKISTIVSLVATFKTLLAPVLVTVPLLSVKVVGLARLSLCLQRWSRSPLQNRR